MGFRKKIVIILIIAIIIFGYLAYQSFSGSVSYYYTLSELKSLDPGDKKIRVKGDLVKDSINWNPGQPLLSFELTDGENTMKMVYNGVKPDNFDHSQDLIVVGKLEDNKFIVSKLMLQCPSKYEEGEE